MNQIKIKLDKTLFDPDPFFRESPGHPTYRSALGALYGTDCMKVLPRIKDAVVDTVFADPPFNLGKEYGALTNDEIPDPNYIEWCKKWVGECVRIVKPGGSVFIRTPLG